MIERQLSITWTEAWLVVVTASGVYVAMIALSRLFGQRQFLRSSSHDLAFIFAMGSLIGRVILVRTSLAVAVVGLATMFSLHALMTFAHHRVHFLHRMIENRPVLVAANGRMLPDMLRKARSSEQEVHQQLRHKGHASLDGVLAVILERDGKVSVLTSGTQVDPAFLGEVAGKEHLRL